MLVRSGIGENSSIKAWHCYESLGGPPILILDIDDNTYEFYCSREELKRLIDELQREYDKSQVRR